MEQAQEGMIIVDSRRLGSARDEGLGLAKHPHSRTTTNLRHLSKGHSKSQASAFKSFEATQE